jgi:hypothetical protein
MSGLIMNARYAVTMLVIVSGLLLISFFFCALPAVSTEITVTTFELLPTVRVGSTNGLNYNMVSSEPFILKAWVGGTCDDPIRSAGVHILDWPGASQNANLTMAPLSKDMPLHEVVLPSGLLVQTPGTDIPEWIKAKLYHACYNAMIETGLPKEKAFAEVREIKGYEFGTLVGYMNCVKLGDDIGITPNHFKEFPAMVNIICDKYIPPGGIEPPPGSAGTPAKDLVQVVHVTGSNLISSPNTTGGKCEVSINATIETDGQATISYQFENEQGTRSAVRSVDIGNSHNAQFTETYDFAKSGEGMGFKPPPGNAPSGPSYGVTPTDNVQGYFKMIGVSHPFESNLASYNIKCEEPEQDSPGLAAVPPSDGGSDGQFDHVQVASIVLPDLVSSYGMQIGGVRGKWGGKIRVNSSKAVSKANGLCLFDYVVDVKNTGTAPTGTFAYRMRAGKKSVTGNHAGIAAGKSSVVMGKVALKPGKYEVVVGFDNMNKIVESNEDNNITKPLRVKVTGTCK